MRLSNVPSWVGRLAVDAALLAAIGAVMGFLGPYDSSPWPLGERLVYWEANIFLGGVVGISIDEAVRRRVGGFWLRLGLVSVLMTPGVTAAVWLVNLVMFGRTFPLFAVAQDIWLQVFILCFATMALRQLAWAQPPAPPASVEPGADPTEAFRKRLSARRRAAVLFAVEADDHYLRVHTDAGEELVTARFADALDELAAAPGFRTHRSWWVAADAIDDVRWLRGRGEARLKCGLIVPISRSNAADLKTAGWF